MTKISNPDEMYKEWQRLHYAVSRGVTIFNNSDLFDKLQILESHLNGEIDIALIVSLLPERSGAPTDAELATKDEHMIWYWRYCDHYLYKSPLLCIDSSQPYTITELYRNLRNVYSFGDLVGFMVNPESIFDPIGLEMDHRILFEQFYKPSQKRVLLLRYMLNNGLGSICDF